MRRAGRTGARRGLRGSSRVRDVGDLCDEPAIGTVASGSTAVFPAGVEGATQVTDRYRSVCIVGRQRSPTSRKDEVAR